MKEAFNTDSQKRRFSSNDSLFYKFSLYDKDKSSILWILIFFSKVSLFKDRNWKEQLSRYFHDTIATKHTLYAMLLREGWYM